MELRFAIPIWLGLGLRVSVSAGEAAVVQKLNNPDRLLAPVGEGFGADKRKQAQVFLKLQARLGLKPTMQKIAPERRGLTIDKKFDTVWFASYNQKEGFVDPCFWVLDALADVCPPGLFFLRSFCGQSEEQPCPARLHFGMPPFGAIK